MFAELNMILIKDIKKISEPKEVDIENPEIFGQFEFTKACTAMGIVKDMGPEE